MHRGRQAGAVREAARHHRRGVPARDRGRGRRPAGGWSRSASCAASTPATRRSRRARDRRRRRGPLLVHCAHRNALAPAIYTSEMLITSSCVHEIDITRWLLGEEIVAATVRAPRSTSQAPDRPRRPAADPARDRERRADRRRGVRQRPLRLRHPLRARRRAAARCGWPSRSRPTSGRASPPPTGASSTAGSRATTERPERVGRLRRQRGRRRVPGVARARRARRGRAGRATRALQLDRPLPEGECHKLVTISGEGCTTLRSGGRDSASVPRVSTPATPPHSPGRIHHGSNPRCHQQRPARQHEPAPTASTSTPGPQGPYVCENPGCVSPGLDA